MKTSSWLGIACSGVLVGTLVAADPTPAMGGEVDANAVARIGEMSVARAAHKATQLESGEVLITGGCSGRCDRGLSSTERFVPGTRRFVPSAAMAIARDSHAAIALADGRVLVAGGWSDQRATDHAEVFDPRASRFIVVGAMTTARASASASLLRDGRVLLAGGQTSAFEPLASAEVFDPATSTFSPMNSMNVARVGHVAVVLDDGRVLIVGGRPSRRGEILRSAEVFDPVGGQFQATGSMLSPRHKHAAALLPDGRVLIIGGSDARDQAGRYRSTEIFDPSSGTFTAGPQMNWPRFKFADSVVTLPSGAILVAGGAVQWEIHDPRTRAFKVIAGDMGTSPEFATATRLPNGDVLLIGGYDDQIRTSASAWLVRAPH